jgi:deazaflavin-dependent oxidoreductase (nitroreductase family)
MKTNKPITNALMRAALGAGLFRASTALLETTGRRSGQARVTPVTNGIDGDVFWIVTEHGHKADYVRNIAVNPRVRVKVGRRWHAGTARIVDEDPERALERLLELNRRAGANVHIVRKVGTEHLVIRVELDRA